MSSYPVPMDKRRHKKSKTGCKNCKFRKVKVRTALISHCAPHGASSMLIYPQCDEQRPTCGNCQRYFMNSEVCDYDHFVKQKVASTTASERDNGSRVQAPILSAIHRPTSSIQPDSIIPLSPNSNGFSLDPFQSYPASKIPKTQSYMHHCTSAWTLLLQ